jgi:hypothetical protein
MSVAGFENADKLLLDIGAEALAVDGAIEDARRCEPVAAQSAKEGQGAPVAMRSIGSQPLAFRSPAAQRRHGGLDPSLVNKDKLGGIETILPGAPSHPPSRHIGAGLLKREQCFF